MGLTFAELAKSLTDGNFSPVVSSPTARSHMTPFMIWTYIGVASSNLMIMTNPLGVFSIVFG